MAADDKAVTGKFHGHLQAQKPQSLVHRRNSG